MTAHEPRDSVRQFWIAAGLSLFAAIAFYFSTNATLHDLDYTNQIASALLSGHVGLKEKPPDWLNEMIPHRNRYYSAFPLGAVLSMVPIALLQKAGVVHNFPGRVLAALIAGCCVYFFFQLAKAFGANYSSLEGTSLVRRIMLALFPIFGTWTWCNLGFGGAWQIALGLALLGETAALYFTLIRPAPFVAGAFFALAFGNRTELLITLPLYLYFFWRRSDQDCDRRSSRILTVKQELWGNRSMVVRFLSVPAILALLTAAYNFARFQSIFDFGYLHIPEVPRGTLVRARAVFDSSDSLEYLHDAASRLREYFLLSLHPPKRVWLLNLSCEPVPMPSFSPGRKIHGGCLDCDRPVNACPLVSRKSRKLAVFVSLRHDSSSLDVSFTDRQRPGENNRQRGVPFRRLDCDQCFGYLVVSLDRPNPALAQRPIPAEEMQRNLTPRMFSWPASAGVGEKTSQMFDGRNRAFRICACAWR